MNRSFNQILHLRDDKCTEGSEMHLFFSPKWKTNTSFKRLDNSIYVIFVTYCLIFFAYLIFLLKMYFITSSMYTQKETKLVFFPNTDFKRNKYFFSVYISLAKHPSFHIKDGFVGQKCILFCFPDFHLLHLF